MTSLIGLLQAQPSGGSNLAVFAIQIGAFIAIFYFLLIRPQRKEQQRHVEMIKALVKGDDVVTNGGIVGRVTRADEQRLTLKTGDVEVVVERARIARKVSAESESE